MILSESAIRYRPICITLVVLLMAWGAISFNTMSRREDPEFIIRTCVVTTAWPGVPATKIEELVTDKLEEQLEKIDDVKTLKSTTITGLSTINVELEDSYPGHDIQNAWDKVRAKIELAVMPDPSIKPIVNDGFGETTILLMAIHQTPSKGHDQIRSQDLYSPRQLEVFADRIRDSLRLLPGVSKVEKYGVQNEALFVETNLSNWARLGLTTDQLKQFFERRNIVEPGGEISTEFGRYSVKPGGELNTIKEFESIIVGNVEIGGSSNPVSLTDLGLTVRRGFEDPPAYYCRVGSPRVTETSVMLGLQMKSGANIVDVCDLAKQRLRQLMEVDRVLPPDLAVTLVSDQSKNVTEKIEGVVLNVVEAILIVVVVVLLFVGFRSSIVMAANIPVVLLASIGIVSMLGVQLEQISLASIIIALGLLVDNAIQVCDQSRTNQINGMNPIEATVEGAKTLSTPMLVGTLTTIAAFLPMLFALEGGSAEFVYSLPVTISVTLGLSWVLAMTFCVILAATFIRVPKERTGPTLPVKWFFILISVIRRDKEQPKSERSSTTTTESNRVDREKLTFRIYGLIASIAVRSKWITIAITVGLFLWAIGLPVATEHFPMDRRDQFAVLVWLPETSTITQTNEKVKQVENIIRQLSPTTDQNGHDVERLRAMRSIVGGGASRWHLSWAPEPRAPNFAEILVRTTDGRFTPDYVNEVRRIVEKGDQSLGIQPIAGVRVIPKELGLGPPTDPLVFRVTGDGFADMTTLREVANRLKQNVREQPETWDVHDSWGISGYQLQVNVDEDKANLADVSNLQIANTLNAYFSGMKLTTFREGDYQIPVYFRLNPTDRLTIDGLQSAFVEGKDRKVPLDAIAVLESRWEPAKIERRNRNRVIEVRSSMEPGASGTDVTKRIDSSQSMKQLRDELPSGFRIEVGGSVEESAKSSSQMVNSFGISFLLIVLCLVFQYNGWAKPLIIVATLPMALIGALPGLYFTGNAMGFMPQLGILSLFGIVLNTGVIFVEFTDILILEKQKEKKAAGTLDGPIVGLTKLEFRECLQQAGKRRMLPIFLTTATTIGGLLPLALDGGPLWTGLAWSMIFGLIIATLLTLLVIPAIYAILVETFRIKPVAVDKAE